MLPLSLVEHKCSFQLTGAEPECLNSAHAMVMAGNLIRMQPLQTQINLKLMNRSLSIIKKKLVQFCSLKFCSGLSKHLKRKLFMINKKEKWLILLAESVWDTWPNCVPTANTRRKTLFFLPALLLRVEGPSFLCISS